MAGEAHLARCRGAKDLVHSRKPAKDLEDPAAAAKNQDPAAMDQDPAAAWKRNCPNDHRT